MNSKSTITVKLINKIRLKIREIQVANNGSSTSLSYIHQYWEETANEDKNKPINYLSQNNIKSKALYLIKFLSELNIDKSCPILELGCGIGSTLNELYQQGYYNLVAIESNLEAIKILKENYPLLYKNNMIINSRFDQILNKLQINLFDVTFCFAVLSHIHPSENYLFYQIANITKKYIILVEAETTISERHFPRNYAKIFQKYGFKQIKTEMTKNKITDYPNMRCRILIKD